MLNNFFQLSHLPPGSVRLRSYAGRSLFNGLFSAPAERKRAGVVDVLNNFPECQFILIGDSGEQDLELYASLARSRPEQILAIFVRDARFGGPGEPAVPLDDPTGAAILGSVSGLGFGDDQIPVGVTMPKPIAVASAPTSRERGGNLVRRGMVRSLSEFGTSRAPPRSPTRTHSFADMPPTFEQQLTKDRKPYTVNPNQKAILDTPISEEPASLPTLISDFQHPPVRRTPPNGYFSSRTSSSSYSSTPSSSRNGSSTPLSEPEKKRQDLQSRVYRARMEAPPSVPIRIFKNPEECVEASHILDNLRVGHGLRM